MTTDPRRMPIGEHLIELRRHILRGLLYLAIGTAVCLAFQEPLMEVVTWPHVRAMDAIDRSAEATHLAETGAPTELAGRILENQESLRTSHREARRTLTRRGGLASPGSLRDLLSEQEELRAEQADLARRLAGADASELPALRDRLEEIRSRIDELEGRVDREVGFLVPGGDRPRASSSQLQVLTYQEAFVNYLKVAIICGLLLTAPLLGWEIWRFVAAGLHAHERRWVTVLAPISGLLFVAGVAFGYTVLIPVALKYLGTYGDPSLIRPAITLDRYLTFFGLLTLTVGVIFQLPLVMAFGALVRFWTADRLAGFRVYFLLLAVISGAIITPPDVISQVLLAIPLVGLYEMGLLAVRFIERWRGSEQTA